ncbi:MAG: permease-like cell division protein FtsX [Bacillota bacterium]
MNLRGWANALRDAIRSMTQSGLMSLASMLSVAVSLLVLAVVLLLAVNLEHMAATAESQVEITAYLCNAQRDEAKCNKQELSEPQKQAILGRVRALPNVREVNYLSRHQALEEMKKTDPAQRDLLAGYEGDQNPLSDEIHVKVVEVAQVRGVAEAILALPGVAKVNYGDEYVDDLMAFTNAIRFGGVGLVLLLLVATVLTLSNTIRLSVFARRREISIMKLVGATDWYIRRPFMLEGIFLGVIGAAVASGVTAYAYARMTPRLQETVPFLPLVHPDAVLSNLAVGLLLLGGVLGAIGSLVSLRRFLKV